MSASSPTRAAPSRAVRALKACRAAVKGAFVPDELAELPRLGHTVGLLADALATYLAHEHCGVTHDALAEAADTTRKQVSRRVRLVEAWREAPLVDELVERLKASLPVEP